LDEREIKYNITCTLNINFNYNVVKYIIYCKITDV